MADTSGNNQKVAVVGSGYWGKNLVRNFNELGVLKAICETNVERGNGLRTQYPTISVKNSYKDLLEDPDITGFVIATPAETHFSIVRDALNYGKDVFVEKPLSLHVNEGQTLVDLAKEKKRILMVGHLLWYHPAIIKLKELIDGGDLGRIQYIYSSRLNLGKIRREENILWSFAPHDISVILGFLGETPNVVTAAGGNFLHPNITDVTVTCFSFPSGVKAHIFVSWLHPYKEQKLVVVGDKKMAVFDDVEKEGKLKLYSHQIEWKNQIPVASKAEAQVVMIDSAEPLRLECQHFLDCMRDRKEPRTNGAEALAVLSILARCQKALESKESDTAVPLESTNIFSGIHPSAVVDHGVEIGADTTIWHFSHVLKGSRIGSRCRIGQNVVIGPRVTIGDGVKIQNNVSVYEGVTLEDNVFCGPSMVFTNVMNPRSEIPRMDELKSTLVKKGATLGANCTVICGHTIGNYSFVGAGSVVTKDVPDYALVVGNPAKFVAWMCRCGVKLIKKGKIFLCPSCGASYRIKNKIICPASDFSRR